jgi:hypothetical protein
MSGASLCMPERKDHLEDRCSCKDNIRMDVEICCEGMDWIDLAQDRDRRAFLNTAVNVRVQMRANS